MTCAAALVVRGGLSGPLDLPAETAGQTAGRTCRLAAILAPGPDRARSASQQGDDGVEQPQWPRRGHQSSADGDDGQR
jgi:hypothetical protein